MQNRLVAKLVRISLAALVFTSLASIASAQFSPIPFIASATANLTATLPLLPSRDRSTRRLSLPP